MSQSSSTGTVNQHEIDLEIAREWLEKNHLPVDKAEYLANMIHEQVRMPERKRAARLVQCSSIACGKDG